MNPLPPPFFFFHCYLSLSLSLLFHFNLGCVVPPPCPFFSPFFLIVLDSFFPLSLFLLLLSLFFSKGSIPYREKQHVLAIDRGPVVSCITSLSSSLSFLLSFLLSFFLSANLLSRGLATSFFPSTRIVSSLPCRA